MGERAAKAVALAKKLTLLLTVAGAPGSIPGSGISMEFSFNREPTMHKRDAQELLRYATLIARAFGHGDQHIKNTVDYVLESDTASGGDPFAILEAMIEDFPTLGEEDLDA